MLDVSPPGQVRLKLGELERVRVSVARAEYLSVLSMLSDAAAGISRGLPPRWRREIGRSVTERGHRAFQPIGAAPSRGWIPECLLPAAGAVDAPFEDVLDGIRSVDRDAVHANLEAEFGAAGSLAWRSALNHPDAWLATCADALTAAATVNRPLWDHARSLLEREFERIGVAVVRGGLRGLLATLNSRIALSGDELVFTHAVAGRYELADRHLVLVPLVAGDRMLMTHFEDAGQVWIGYPVTGVGDLWAARSERAHTDDLSELLGPARAAIFRLAQRGSAMGALAEAAGYKPATVTFHCDRLERAGLLERHRRGREVHVAHTALGSRLATAYTPPRG